MFQSSNCLMTADCTFFREQGLDGWFCFEKESPEGELHAHLQRCLACQKEFQALGSLLHSLKQWPFERPVSSLSARSILSRSSSPSGERQGLTANGRRAPYVSAGLAAFGVHAALFFIFFLFFYSSVQNGKKGSPESAFTTSFSPVLSVRPPLVIPPAFSGVPWSYQPIFHTWLQQALTRNTYPDLEFSHLFSGWVDSLRKSYQAATQIRYEEKRKRERLGFLDRGYERLQSQLALLASWQESDGRWTYRKEFFPRGAPRKVASGEGKTARSSTTVSPLGRYDLALTGLALLAFLDDGHTPFEGTYHQTVYRGLTYLLHHQTESGLLGSPVHPDLYNHALSGLALAGAVLTFGREGQSGVLSLKSEEAAFLKELRQTVYKAAFYSLQAQNSDGGWGYLPQDQSSEIVVTAWQTLFLRDSLFLKFLDSAPALERTNQWLFLLTDAQGREGYSQPAYFPYGMEGPTATGFFLRLELGWSWAHPLMNRQLRYLSESLKRKAVPFPDETSIDFTTDLYASQSFLLLSFSIPGAQSGGGNHFRAALEKKTQRTLSVPSDRWTPKFGAVYATALHALLLESAYTSL